MTWDELVAATKARGFTLHGKLTERTPGGFSVDIGLDVAAFLHMQQLGEVLPADVAARDALLAGYLGRELELAVIMLNKKTRNIVVSHKVVLDRERPRRKAELYKTLAVGQVREGVVKHVLEDRAFVDLGGIDAVLQPLAPDVVAGRRMAFEIELFDPSTDRIRLRLPAR